MSVIETARHRQDEDRGIEVTSKSCPTELVAGCSKDKIYTVMESDGKNGKRFKESEKEKHLKQTVDKMSRLSEKQKGNILASSTPPHHFLTYKPHFGYQEKGIAPRHLWHCFFSSPESY